MPALDARPLDRTAQAGLAAYQNAAAERQRKIDADELALEIARENQERARAEDARKATEETAKQQLPIGADDVVQWQTSDPRYQVPFHEAPQEARDHFINARRYDPAVAAQIPKLWNESLPNVTGKIPGLDGMEQTGAHVTDGKVTKTYATPKPSEGVVFPSIEAAEAAGHNAEGATLRSDGSVLINKVARNDISRRKLGVNEKNALSGALTAANSLENIERDFNEIEKQGKTGPIAGRWQEMKQKVGYADQQFAEFSAQTSGNLFNLARSLQGAGVLTEQDIIRMETIVPTGKMTKEQFMGQLAGVRSLMTEKLKAWKIANDISLTPEQKAQVDGMLAKIEKGAGRKALPSGQPAKTAPAAPTKPSAAPTATAPASDRITVISPDGKTGSIPKSQLSEAIAAGYKTK